jgi:hypothetical protein
MADDRLRRNPTTPPVINECGSLPQSGLRDFAIEGLLSLMSVTCFLL